MVLYSSTNFHIWKTWATVSNPIRFYLDFWQASKPFYRKLNYRHKVLEEFQCFPRFSIKMVLYSSTNFRILKPWATISNLIRFYLGFWQAWKPFYKKLKHREKLFEEFQHLRRFPRKMVLYLSTNFRILNPWGIICNLIRFDLEFSQASKPFYRKVKYREKILEEFQRLPHSPRIVVLYSSNRFRILKPWDIISNLIRFDLALW